MPDSAIGCPDVSRVPRGVRPVTAPTLVRRKKKPMVALPSDPQWYKDAVIYQLHVKA